MELPTKPPHDHRPRFRFSLRMMFASFTVLTFVIGGAFILIGRIEEAVLNGYRIWGTGEMLVDYMRSHNDQWPKDWNDVRMHMVEHPSQFAGMGSVDEIQSNIEIDFNFNPGLIDTTVELHESKPTFRAVWLRNGKSTGYDANEIIFRYLKARAKSRTHPFPHNGSELGDPLKPREGESNG